MKRKLLTILLTLSSLLLKAQIPYHWYFSPGEYTSGFLDSAGHPWTVTTDVSLGAAGNTGTQGIPTRVITVPANKIMAGAQTGLHDGSFWSADSGRVFMYGQANHCQLGNGLTTGPSTTYEILTDINGHQFQNITSVTAGWGPVSGVPFYAAVKSNGGDTVWVWGDLANLGGSTCAEPTPLIVSVGRTASKIYAYNSSLHVVCTDGTVWVIGGTDDYAANTGVNATPTTFTQVTGIPAISYLAKGNSFVFAITSTGDSVYGWGEYGWVLKGLNTNTFSPTTSPLLLNTQLASILPLDTLVATHNAWEGIRRTDSTLWGSGSNEVGTLGIGATINWNTYTVSPSPTGGTPQYWNWDVGMGEFVTGLTQIAKGKHNFIHLFGGPQYSFYIISEDVNGNDFGAGRLKAAGLLLGIIPADTLGSRIAGSYHVSWDINNLTELFPLVLISLGHGAQIVASSPGCVNGLFSGTPCSFGTDAPSRPNTNLVSTLVVTSLGSTVYTNNTTSTTDVSHKIMLRWMTQTAGTTLNMGVYTGQVDTISGVAPGTYTIQQTIVDNSSDTVNSSTTFTVLASQNYWVDAIAGSDANNGTSQATPFKTITKLNTVNLIAGDTVRFKRGGTYPGGLIANHSGSLGSPIVFRPYGSGSQPVIGGMDTVTGWSMVSTNLWQASYAGVKPNFLCINGVFQTISRNPNTGYFLSTTYTTTSLTDAVNAGAAPIGARITVRSSPETLDTTIVTSNSGGVVGFSPAISYNVTGMGGGWFVTNNQPDVPGEWRYIGGAIQLYSLTNPGTTVTVAGIDTNLLTQGSYLVFDSLSFIGGNNANIIAAFQPTANILFRYDTLEYGYDGIQLRSDGNITVDSCYFAHMSNDGILKQNNNNYNNLYQGDTFIDIGMIAGMGRSGINQSYTALTSGDSGSIVRHCTINNVGYIGITNYGSGFMIDSNFILNFCQVLEDGGGIYTWMGAPATFARLRQIIGNIVGQGGTLASEIGVSVNFVPAGEGIYLDNYTSNVLVEGNTVFQVTGCLLFDHGPGNTIINNNGLNGGFAQLFIAEVGPVINGLVVKNNVLGFDPIGPYMNYFYTINNDISTFGVIDSNAYLVPQTQLTSFFTKSATDIGTLRNILSWQVNTGYDLNGSSVQYSPLILVYSIPGGTFSLPGQFVDAQGNIYNNSITLGAYQSKILRQLSTWNLTILKGSLINL